MTTARKSITDLLKDHAAGDRDALGELFPRIYRELHRIASAQMRRQPANHTWQPTALVHEVYLKLCAAEGISWQSRKHFFALSAKIMRQLLVNHALAKKAGKRGGGAVLIAFDENFHTPADLGALDLDRLLRLLEPRSARQASIVELRFFGGLTTEEVAETLGISASTVKREWELARLWLYRQLKKEEGGP